VSAPGPCVRAWAPHGFPKALSPGGAPRPCLFQRWKYCTVPRTCPAQNPASLRSRLLIRCMWLARQRYGYVLILVPPNKHGVNAWIRQARNGGRTAGARRHPGYRFQLLAALLFGLAFEAGLLFVKAVGCWMLEFPAAC